MNNRVYLEEDDRDDINLLDENLTQEPTSVGYEYRGQSQPTNNTEVKPVAMGKKAVGGILILLLVFAIILCFVFRGCSVSKKVEGTSNTKNTENRVSTESKPMPTESAVSSNNSVENTTEFLESVSTLPNVNNYETIVSPEGTGGLVEVAIPSLTSVKSTSGMVSGKKVYKIEDSYVYEVSIITLTGTDTNVVCKYFCPKKSYDALSMGDSVKVQYQVDSNNGISIYSLSK